PRRYLQPRLPKRLSEVFSCSLNSDGLLLSRKAAPARAPPPSLCQEQCRLPPARRDIVPRPLRVPRECRKSFPDRCATRPLPAAPAPDQVCAQNKLAPPAYRP